MSTYRLHQVDQGSRAAAATTESITAVTAARPELWPTRSLALVGSASTSSEREVVVSEGALRLGKMEPASGSNSSVLVEVLVAGLSLIHISEPTRPY